MRQLKRENVVPYHGFPHKPAEEISYDQAVTKMFLCMVLATAPLGNMQDFRDNLKGEKENCAYEDH